MVIAANCCKICLWKFRLHVIFSIVCIPIKITGFHLKKCRTKLYIHIPINTNVIILIEKMKSIVKTPNMDLLLISYCCFLSIAAFTSLIMLFIALLGKC